MAAFRYTGMSPAITTGCTGSPSVGARWGPATYSSLRTAALTGIKSFGRERELAMLDETPERGAALLVRGEAGIGKSALVAAASWQAETAGMQVLRTTAGDPWPWIRSDQRPGNQHGHCTP